MNKEKINVFNFHLTNACNYHCSYCFGKFQTNETLTFEKACLVVDNIARYFRAKGIVDGRINLAGGEPLLYPHLDKLIEYIYSSNIKVSLVTNGSLLTKERVYSWKGKVDCIGLSVDSAFEQTNKAIGRCCKNDCVLKKETLVALAKCIKENGIKLKINTVVSRLNIHEDMREFYKGLQVDRLKFFQMQIVDGVNNQASKNQISREEFRAFCLKHQKCGKEVVLEVVGAMENSYLMIDPKGGFLLNDGGNYKSYGDCLKEELLEIMKSVPFNNEKFGKRYNNEYQGKTMSKYKEINLEEGLPTVDEAMSYLKMSITLCKQNKIGCLAVIHGYGSSGKGGAIRAKARQWLNAQVRNGTIKAVINGEDFDVLNFKALELKNKYKELEKLLKVCNHGMTVVEV